MTMNSKLISEAFTCLWSEEGVLIAVNPKHPHAILPKHLVEQEHIILDYDPCAIVPINDLVTDETGIAATLSFDRTPCKTFVPWEAVLGIAPRLQTSPTPEIKATMGPGKKQRPRHLAIVR
jgi:hypothetical protein